MAALSILRALPALLLAVFAFSSAGCNSMAGIPAPLTDALTQVTGLSGNIADWGNQLGETLGGEQFDQLKSFADRAGNLGGSINDLKSQVGEAMANPLGAIGDKLEDMAGIDVDRIRDLVPAEQMEAVKGFTGSAGEVKGLAEDFMTKFAN